MWYPDAYEFKCPVIHLLRIKRLELQFLKIGGQLLETCWKYFDQASYVFLGTEYWQKIIEDCREEKKCFFFIDWNGVWIVECSCHMRYFSLKDSSVLLPSASRFYFILEVSYGTNAFLGVSVLDPGQWFNIPESRLNDCQRRRNCCSNGIARVTFSMMAVSNSDCGTYRVRG